MKKIQTKLVTKREGYHNFGVIRCFTDSTFMGQIGWIRFDLNDTLCEIDCYYFSSIRSSRRKIKKEAELLMLLRLCSYAKRTKRQISMAHSSFLTKRLWKRHLDAIWENGYFIIP